MVLVPPKSMISIALQGNGSRHKARRASRAKRRARDAERRARDAERRARDTTRRARDAQSDQRRGKTRQRRAETETRQRRGATRQRRTDARQRREETRQARARTRPRQKMKQTLPIEAATLVMKPRTRHIQPSSGKKKKRTMPIEAATVALKPRARHIQPSSGQEINRICHSTGVGRTETASAAHASQRRQTMNHNMPMDAATVAMTPRTRPIQFNRGRKGTRTCQSRRRRSY